MMLQTESLLLIALGFGVAMVLALIFGFVMWSAANRWVEARRKKSIPGMILNLQAERSSLRAENAMTEQRYRFQLDKANEALAEAEAEVTRHRNRGMAGAEALSARDSEIAALQAAISRLELESKRRGMALVKMREQRRTMERGKTAGPLPTEAELDVPSLATASEAVPQETARRIRSRIAEIKSKVTETVLDPLPPILPSPLDASSDVDLLPGTAPKMPRFPKPVLVSSLDQRTFEKPEIDEEPEKKLSLAEKFKAIKGGMEL